MTSIRISTGDMYCRYIAAPESSCQSPFGRHLQAVGIKLPEGLSLRKVAARGWLRPRLRVAIPVAALQSWTTFPSHPLTGDEACPPDDLWGLEVWTNTTCPIRERDTPDDRLWMHWLDDPGDTTTANARKHALNPAHDPEPTPFVHPYRGSPVHPWIDFFADWQAYHVAELVRSAVFTVHGMTDQASSWDTYLRERAREFDQDAQKLAERWEKRGAFFDVVGCYRTILARCCQRELFYRDVRAGARAFAAQRGIDASGVKRGIRDVLLQLWQRWKNSPPVADPRLMLRLQQDIQYAVHLWSDLSGEPIDPFDSAWFSKSRSRGESAMLIDALPHEEWLARRDFAQSAVRYQRGFPSPFPMGEEQFADLLARHWEPCPPLRRFCLAWVRLRNQLRSQDHERHADQTISANERIEQFNLIALHTERLLRHVAAVPLATAGKQDGSVKVIRSAAQRSLTHLHPAVSVPDQHVDDLLKRHTSLHSMPDLAQQICLPSQVASGSDAADNLIAAHVNALIARNYAAHHDYLDDELIYPSRDEAKPHVGATLMSSCLLVVVAALHSLSPQTTTPQP